MKVVKETRLVPIEFDSAWGRYQKGDTGGVQPADVAPIITGKFGKLAKIPSEIETADVSDDEVMADLRQTTNKSKEELNIERQAAIEIPDGWADMHHLQRLKIAADIRGAKVDSVPLADATIQDELARRGEAVRRFGVDLSSQGNVANQKDGGPSMVTQSAVAASVPIPKAPPAPAPAAKV